MMRAKELVIPFDGQKGSNDALIAVEKTEDTNGNTVFALPYDRLLAVLGKYGR